MQKVSWSRAADFQVIHHDIRSSRYVAAAFGFHDAVPSDGAGPCAYKRSMHALKTHNPAAILFIESPPSEIRAAHEARHFVRAAASLVARDKRIWAQRTRPDHFSRRISTSSLQRGGGLTLFHPV